VAARQLSLKGKAITNADVIARMGPHLDACCLCPSSSRHLLIAWLEATLYKLRGHFQWHFWYEQQLRHQVLQQRL
jgi:hypothetical protein